MRTGRALAGRRRGAQRAAPRCCIWRSIAGGPDWYRFLGAGERHGAAGRGGLDPRPTLIALGIAAVLAIWSAYALAGAGLIPRLPLMRTALVAITAVYLLRGLVLLPALAINGGRVEPLPSGGAR